MPTRSIKPIENKRHRVQHNYHDYSQDTPPRVIDNALSQNEAFSATSTLFKRGSPLKKFPIKLHELLEQAEADGFSDIISWKIHGRAFAVHNAKEFMVRIMPLHFQQSKIRSFFRQLNLYGFLRITEGPDRGAYYHERFLRGMPFLAARISRQKVKGTQVKGLPSPETEPDFFSMPFVMRTSSLPSVVGMETPSVNPEGFMLLSCPSHPVCNSENNIVKSTSVHLLPHTKKTSREGKSTDCGLSSLILNAYGNNTLQDGGGLGNALFDMIPCESSLSDFSLFDDENSCMSMLQMPNSPDEFINNASDALFEAIWFYDGSSLQEKVDPIDESTQFYSWQECKLLCALLQGTST
jgi:hypothetical protein